MGLLLMHFKYYNARHPFEHGKTFQVNMGYFKNKRESVTIDFLLPGLGVEFHPIPNEKSVRLFENTQEYNAHRQELLKKLGHTIPLVTFGATRQSAMQYWKDWHLLGSDISYLDFLHEFRKVQAKITRVVEQTEFLPPEYRKSLFPEKQEDPF